VSSQEGVRSHQFHQISRHLPRSQFFRSSEHSTSFRTPSGTPIALEKHREGKKMETVVIGAALLGSFAGAFVVQKAALGGLLRMMDAGRRVRR